MLKVRKGQTGSPFFKADKPLLSRTKDLSKARHQHPLPRTTSAGGRMQEAKGASSTNRSLADLLSKLTGSKMVDVIRVRIA